jgi:hypothetical protein
MHFVAPRWPVVRELVSTLRERERRVLRWSAAAAAGALWFAIAWRDAWVLLFVPLIATSFVAWVKHGRRPGAGADADDEAWL